MCKSFIPKQLQRNQHRVAMTKPPFCIAWLRLFFFLFLSCGTRRQNDGQENTPFFSILPIFLLLCDASQFGMCLGCLAISLFSPNCNKTLKGCDGIYCSSQGEGKKDDGQSFWMLAVLQWLRILIMDRDGTSFHFIKAKKAYF
ncbi:hypothetical protein BC940DRAFT_288094 [Gongronella butleri]|nr:hypothetical protein BC940DRAFT_288094 [Gongronella butleri]